MNISEPFKAAGGEDPGGGGLFVADNIHPSASGQKIIADEINKVMKANCVGQLASSGCCAP